MSERFAQEMPQSTGPVSCDTWVLRPEDEDIMRAVLRAGGVDLDSGTIDRALATAKPIGLSTGAQSALSARELEIYKHEQTVLHQYDHQLSDSSST